MVDLLDNRNVGTVASQLICQATHDVVDRKGQAVIGLVGGSCVQGVLEKLHDADMPWGDIHIILLDERVTDDEGERNITLIRDALGEKVPEKRIHGFTYDPHSHDWGAAAYTRIVHNLGGIDVAVLSAGEDGHVASLFPGHRAMWETREGFVLVEDAPNPPARRISASRALITSARYGVLLFCGMRKEAAFKRYFDTSLGVEECPAKLIGKMDRAWVVTDLDRTRQHI